MNVEESIALYGLRPSDPDQLDEIRRILYDETVKESRRQGDGDTELIKLCCIQLFSQGSLSDVLRIWAAKKASMDADCAVDIQLLCGAGLASTKDFLSREDNKLASDALARICECEASGDFEDFAVDEQMMFYEDYYS